MLEEERSYTGITNQSTVCSAEQLASLFWYLIASTIDTLHQWLWNCMYMELEVQCTCMYNLNKCWFHISKTYCFCFLLSLNCENLAKQLLQPEFSRIDIWPSCFVYDLSNTIFCPIGSALMKHRVASQIWTHNSKRLAYMLTT